MRDLAAMRTMIRGAREARGWSRTDLSQAASNLAPQDQPIDPNLIWRIEERIAFVPPPLVIRPIAAALDLDLLDLLAAAGYFDVPGEP